jgi:hypothetical protein
VREKQIKKNLCSKCREAYILRKPRYLAFPGTKVQSAILQAEEHDTIQSSLPHSILFQIHQKPDSTGSTTLDPEGPELLSKKTGTKGRKHN